LAARPQPHATASCYLTSLTICGFQGNTVSECGLTTRMTVKLNVRALTTNNPGPPRHHCQLSAACGGYATTVPVTVHSHSSSMLQRSSTPASSEKQLEWQSKPTSRLRTRVQVTVPGPSGLPQVYWLRVGPCQWFHCISVLSAYKPSSWNGQCRPILTINF
jgi:hypothetical protein